MPVTSAGMTARRRFYLRGTRRRRRSVPSVTRSMKRLPTFVATRSRIRTSWNDDRPQFARLTASCVAGPSASFAFEIAVDLINNCGRNLAPFSRRCRCRRPRRYASWALSGVAGVGNIGLRAFPLEPPRLLTSTTASQVFPRREGVRFVRNAERSQARRSPILASSMSATG
jgi:hypothetical protein